MNITQIAIPKWNGVNGNYSDGRVYYVPTMLVNGAKVPDPRYGTVAQIDKIIYHWMDGTLESTDKTFANPNRMASAHFGIEGSEVHQYVPLSGTSYNSGNGVANCESISFEQAGGRNNPITDGTYATSSEMTLKMALTFGWSLDTLRSRMHKHNEYVATECPGNLDLDRICIGALNLAGGIQIITTSAPTVHVSYSVPTTFWVQVIAQPSLNVRTAPNCSAEKVPSKQLYAGDTLEIAEGVQGESINGVSLWYKTKVSGLFIWSGGVQEISKQA